MNLKNTRKFTIITIIVLILPLFTIAQKKPDAIKFGKYGCTSSKYKNGFYEYTPKGFFTITKDGKYTYSGFKTPSVGTYNLDSAGNILFKGGYLDGGKAEKIDRPNKFFLVFPTIPDNRWTCGCVDK